MSNISLELIARISELKVKRSQILKDCTNGFVSTNEFEAENYFYNMQIASLEQAVNRRAG